MEKVDGVEVHVLGVPGEGGLPHSEVEVGRVHSVDLDVVVLVHPVQDGAQFLDVPMLKLKWKMFIRDLVQDIQTSPQQWAVVVA